MTIKFEGDIFSLNGDAQYEGDWGGINVLRANAGVDVSVAVNAEANLCHGLQVALGAQASAEAQLALSMFIAGSAEGRAFAAAGANVKVSLAPDLFDRFGLTVDVGTFAEAAVAGSLSIGLDIGQIRQLAEALASESPEMVPNQLAIDIFNAFLDELDIRAGVWGRAAFSAMARGYLSVYGSLADSEQAGFVFELGGSIGLKAGTGWDCFAVAQLRNVDRFYQRTSELITAEVVRVAKEELPIEYHAGIELVNLCLPAVLHVSMVAGQATATSLVADNNRVAEPIVNAIMTSMERYILRKLADAGEILLQDLVIAITEYVRNGQLNDEDREQLRTYVQNLIDRLEANDKFSLTNFIGIAADVTDMTQLVFPDALAAWREPLAAVWCSLAIAHAMEEIIEPASGSVGILGYRLSAGLAEDDFNLPDAPEIIFDEFEQRLGARPAVIKLSDAIDYLAHGSIAPFISEILPDIGLFLNLIEDELDITAGDIVSATLLGTVGGDLSSSELYQKLRDFLRKAIDDNIDQEILPALKQYLPQSEDTRLYVGEVVEPSLLGCTNFVFERLDGIVGGNIDAVFIDSFRMGLSNLVYKVFARNVIVLGYIVNNHVMNAFESQIGALRQDVADDPNHIMVETGTALATALSVRLVSEATARTATQQLVVDLLATGQLAFGSNTWTPQRRTLLRQLLLAAFASDDQNVDYRSRTGLDAYFREILECNHIPNAAAVANLGELLADITLEQIKVLIEYIPPALANFFLALTSEAVDALDTRARNAIDSIANTAEMALRNANEFARLVDQWKDQAELAALEFAAQLTLIENQLTDDVSRETILTAIHDFGVNKVIADVAAITPGWDSLNNTAKGAALAVPLGVYEGVFMVAKPFLDSALLVLGNIIGDVAETIRQAAAIDNVANDIGTLLIDKTKQEVNNRISQFGLVLPEEISVDDVASIAKNLLLTDELAGWLRSTWQHASAEAEAKRGQAFAEIKESQERQIHTNKSLQLDNLTGGALSIVIESPAGLEARPEHRFIYGPLVPFKITIFGANLTFVETSDVQRVFLSINGQTLTFRKQDWKSSANGILYKADLHSETSPINAGLNVLECSVTNANDNIIRQKVSFIIDPTAPIINRIAVQSEYSQFDVPDKNDHRRTQDEYVSFINKSDAPILIEGWRLQDAAKHRFVLPDRTIDPGDSFRVITGNGTDSDDRIYLGRRSALWNNSGDTVFLIDSQGILRTQYTYPETIDNN